MEPEIKISKRKLKSLHKNNRRSASSVRLIYVTDKDPGITRIRAGGGFTYKSGKRAVRDRDTLQRIRGLVIPPAWEQVWICEQAEGHLQATGVDARGRKQYKYHPLWTKLRNHTKFSQLPEFAKALPSIREHLNKDLAQKELTQTKVLAAVVSIMLDTGIRIGNNAYEKLYGSFGLTTLKDRHVSFKGNKAVFSFRGKKGVSQLVTIDNKKLAHIIKQCRDIPGKELFQYFDEQGSRHTIDSGMVNNYIKHVSGGDFTAKDIRTWTGTALALDMLATLEKERGEAYRKKYVVVLLDMVAEKLGNTRTVCKKYYVHPLLLELYENTKLDKYLKRLDLLKGDTAPTDQKPEETVLLKVLEKEMSAVHLEP